MTWSRPTQRGRAIRAAACGPIRPQSASFRRGLGAPFPLGPMTLGPMTSETVGRRLEMRAIRCAVTLDSWMPAPVKQLPHVEEGPNHARQRNGQVLLPDACAPMRLLVGGALHAQTRIHARTVPAGTV